MNPVHEHSRDSFSCLTHRGTLAYKEDLVGLEGGSPDVHTIDALETFLQFFSGRFCSVAHVGHAQWELFRRVSTLVDFNPVRTWGSESFADMRIASKVFEGVLSVFRTRPKEQVDALRELVSVRGVGRTTYQDYLVADAIKVARNVGSMVRKRREGKSRQGSQEGIYLVGPKCQEILRAVFAINFSDRW